MRFIIPLIILAIALSCLPGCTSRPTPPQVAEEPETCWIMAQYAKNGEAATDERRLREGW